MKKKPITKKASIPAVLLANEGIVPELRLLVESARERVASFANTELTLLYWRVGERIRREILNEKRAEYGAGILPTLSAKLVPLYGDGFGERNLARMIKFAEFFPDEQIELLELGRSGIRVAEYLTELPPRDLLEQKLHTAIERARLRLDAGKEEPDSGRRNRS